MDAAVGMPLDEQQRGVELAEEVLFDVGLGLLGRQRSVRS